MQKLTFLILLITTPFGIWCQTNDNKACRDLYAQEKFEEAYQCYKTDKEELFSVYMAAYLAKFLEYKKDYRALYKSLLSSSFDQPEKYFYAANLHPKNSKQFLKVLNKGIKLYPSDTTLLVEKVNYFVEIERYDEAVPVLEQLIDLKNDDLDVYVTIGNLYNQQAKYQKAIPYYIQVLELDKDNQDANLGLGLIYYKEAIDLIQRAGTSSNPEENELIENEALSLLKKALPFLRTAYGQDTTSTDLKSALLTCYKRLDMQSEYDTLKND